MQQSFFEINSPGYPTMNAGAEFSADRKHRFALWRIWDAQKPLVAFIGLNPSTADETEPDRTIGRVVNFANSWGFGGVYMMNCFSYVSTDPNELNDFDNTEINDTWLRKIGEKCERVVFAWGTFEVIKKKNRDVQLVHMFPEAMALKLTKDGSPYHPLYVKGTVVPFTYDATKILNR